MLDKPNTVVSPAAEIALINRTAATIYRFYLSYRHGFRQITRRARRRFAERDWFGMQQDAGERFDIYPARLNDALSKVQNLLGKHVEHVEIWGRIRETYTRTVGNCEDRELAETFFNSVARRIFSTVGVNPDIEFVRPESGARDPCSETPVTQTYSVKGSLESLMAEILSAYDLGIPHENMKRDAREIAAQINNVRSRTGPPIDRIDMVRTPFFRGKGAYLIGRLSGDNRTMPMAVAVINRRGQAVCDGLIRDVNGMRILFSYTHSYFHVDTDSAVELVRFLRNLLPEKRPAELFISLGYNRHGKTELYRDLIHHQTACEAPFETSPGKRGMVMAVFNMPNDDLVFKMIKDRFAKPKRTTRRAVMGKYDFVARHDRAGRLPDTQSFEFLKFERCCFSDTLLEELQKDCSNSIAVTDKDVVLKFVYVERRVFPLDVYLTQADEAQSRAAVIDFGNAIKDLALSNIFPGDMLIKNFGVTRLGRVIFYDYDEICPLTDCRFRRKPKARIDEDELAADPWYHVEESDVFPEEFEHFLGLTGGLRRTFLDHHGDLLDVAFWQNTQEQVKSGKLFNIFPYQRFSRTA